MSEITPEINLFCCKMKVLGKTIAVLLLLENTSVFLLEYFNGI